jgi:hypothetical protein
MAAASGQGTVYCVDTSALIDGIERFYPLANFPALWERVDDLIDTGRLIVSEEAWKEVFAADAPLKQWASEAHRAKCVCPTTAEIATVAGEIAAQFPKWAKQGTKNSADPFVVAVGEVHSYTVISGETNGGPGTPKIPYVCGQRGVHHGRFIDVVTKEGWVFG